MDNIEHVTKQIDPILEDIKDEIADIKPKLGTLFKIDEVFTSETGGKTKLNRQLFNEINEFVLKRIGDLDEHFAKINEVVRATIQDLLAQNNQFVKQDLTHMVFDDKNFMDILGVDLDNHGIVKYKQKFLEKEIKSLLSIKNRVCNLKFYVSCFNPTFFDIYINKLGIEDLINSSVIFDIINYYGLQFEAFTQFKNEIDNFTEEKKDSVKSFQFLNNILELYKKRTDFFFYAGVKYKIFLDYDNDIFLSKALKTNKNYIENIVGNLIEQSCMDLIKKELKRGKIQKQIEIDIFKKRRNVVISVKNNGFEIKNVYNLFVSDLDNQYMIDAKNLASEIGGILDVQVLENEGMQYNLILKV